MISVRHGCATADDVSPRTHVPAHWPMSVVQSVRGECGTMVREEEEVEGRWFL